MVNSKLNEDGIEEYGVLYVIFENLIILLQIAFGFLTMMSLRFFSFPLVSVSYLVFFIIVMGIVLRKILCTNCCYYGKLCHCGWGKLSSLMFKKGTGNTALGGILAGFSWGFLMVLPILVTILMVVFKITTVNSTLKYIIPFAVFCGLNFVLHVKDCKECKMRDICPGSAVKTN